MASAYLDMRKLAIDQETKKQTEEIRKEILGRLPTAPLIKTPLVAGMIGGMAFGVFLASTTGLLWLVLLGLGAGLAVGWCVHKARKDRFTEAYTALRKEEQERIARAEAEGLRRFEDEKNAFTEATKAARVRFGHNTKVSMQVIRWLVAGFTAEIRAADRKPHIREVSASYAFSVSETGIRAGYSTYDFFTNRYNNLTSFVDQVGFAQAMALIVQHDILLAFPSDPSDNSGRRSSVSIDANDNNMILTYKAANGNYIHAKNL